MLSKNIQERVMARNIFAPPSSTHAYLDLSIAEVRFIFSGASRTIIKESEIFAGA
jgi:hypothetical protein